MSDSPMMEQYKRIKAEHTDCLLFFRVGDFYEMFYDDALVASQVCELVLTGKDCGEKERAPMCGVPYHSVEPYLGKLISAGYKVAICEQTEDPKLAKGIVVDRDVIRIVTPGTLIEEALLGEGNNYICSAYITNNSASLTSADISTGELNVTCFTDANYLEKLIDELCVYAPKELVINLPRETVFAVTNEMVTRFGTCICDNVPELFEKNSAIPLAKNKFGNEITENSFSAIQKEISEISLGALVSYLIDMGKSDPASIKHVKFGKDGQHLEMSVNARRSLELCSSMHTGEKRGSLLSVIDKTKTTMGGRMIKSWLERPLVNPNLINERLDAVSELFDSQIARDEIKDYLSKISDIERLSTRIAYKTANPKDLKALEYTLAILPKLKSSVSNFQSKKLLSVLNRIDTLNDVYELINKMINDQPPFSVREGNIIKDGYNQNVDYLRSALKDGKSWIMRLEANEKELTGIPKLRVGYNKVFGYYIEVTNSYKDKVPDYYIRKQTLANCERYITDDLKNMESTVLGAKEKVESIEYEMFMQLLSQLSEHIERLQKTAYAIAELDVLRAFAECADINGYTRPEVDIGDIIDIKDGRHPVVEAYLKDSMFVPNDTYLDSEYNKLALITGPNMAGKSTYMRQTALIIIMAQIGSFVPAKSARIGVIDKLFTRVGASDDLAFGKSTFMLEMSEVAYILKNATNRSFIIYDEIGRGTSTYDGMSIAKAVVEYTVSKKCGAKTLFATHYHELSELENTYEGVVNYNIKAKKHGEDIIFLRKIVKGVADDSYGIEVARLAGVPKELVLRAKKILDELETGKQPVIKHSNNDGENIQLSFADEAEKQVSDLIRSTDIDTLSPIEALNVLNKLKHLLD